MIKRARSVEERGLYLTLVAVFGVALIGFCALVLELGLVAAAQSRLQNITNLAALGAIESYTRYTPPAGQASSEAARRESVRMRVNQILAQNSLWGLLSNLSIGAAPSVDSGESSMVVGEWIRVDPPGASNPCSGSYPCFRPAADNTPGNAIRISLRNEPANPFHRFLGKLFGPDTYTIRAEGTATLVKRCTAYLLDVSLSVATESHPLHVPRTLPTIISSSQPVDPYRHSRLFYAAPDNPQQPNPRSLGAFAFIDSSINRPACGDIASFSVGDQPNYSQALWCSMYDVSREVLEENGVDWVGAHFRTDFRKANSPFGNVWIDLVTRPEPLNTFLLGFNAGLRSVYAESSNADKALFAAFSGAVNLGGVDRRFPTTGLTDNFPFLIQLTNLDNIGALNPMTGAVTGQVLPNLITAGIFPLLGGAIEATATNLPGVLEQAIDELDAQCEASDRRSIVLATDGLPSCYVAADNSTVCGNSWQIYQQAESQLLGRVLPRLRERQISLTVLQAGNYVSPNFKNIPTGACGGSIGYPDGADCFLDFQRAQLAGFGGLSIGANGAAACGANSFVDCQSYEPLMGCPSHPQCDFFAHQFLGSPGVVFGRVNGLMAELAFKSGGQYCPILPLAAGSNAYVDHDGDGVNRGGCGCQTCTPCRLSNQYRATQPRGVSTVSLEKLSKGEQAAACARKTVADNPFILVEEDQL